MDQNSKVKNRLKVTPKRLELKDLLRIRDIQSIQSALLCSPLGFHCPFPSRQINSLYFDDFHYSSLEESLSGASIRRKVRLRWYGETEYAENPTLEFKCKKGHLSWKILRKTQSFIDFNAPSWNTAFLHDPGKSRFDLYKILPSPNLIPITLVSYDRSYFESADGRIRVTIDKDLTFRDQTIYSYPNLLLTRNLPQQLIVEIKLAEKDSSSLQVLYKTLPFVPRRFSKYCESLLKYNSQW